MNGGALMADTVTGMNQLLAGGNITSQDLVIAGNELGRKIAGISAVIATLKSTSLSDRLDRDIKTLQSSWAAEECEEYIKNLLETKVKVDNAIAALQLLGETYQKARDLITANQKRVLSSINNMR
jgi:hypothetical protein